MDCVIIAILNQSMKERKKMIKCKSEMKQNIEIDLSGPDGNAFVLLGYAKTYAKQLGLDVDYIQDEMKSGDYENLIEVFDKYFGAFVTLYR